MHVRGSVTATNHSCEPYSIDMTVNKTSERLYGNESPNLPTFLELRWELDICSFNR